MIKPQRLILGQFNLRSLFAITTAVAICALVYRLTGWADTGGVALAFFLLGSYLVLRRYRAHWSLRATTLTAAIAIVWMVGVDFSMFQERCDHCNSHWDIAEVRIFHQPLYLRKGKDHNVILKSIAEDLGSPCQHEYERFHMIRMWGFCMPGPPCFTGTCCLAGNDQYPDELHARAIALGAREPEVGAQLQRALKEKDFNSIKAIFMKLRSMPEAEEIPVSN